jgi:uncharacterized protein (UPF0333 family)
MKKSQASSDYLMLLGLIFFIIFIVIIYSWKPLNDLNSHKASFLLEQIVDNINHISELGSGNQVKVTLNIPSGVDMISIEDNFISIIVNNGTDSEIVLTDFVKSNVIGYLSHAELTPGNQEFIFISLSNNIVCATKVHLAESECNI